jgi:hypothetical protein
MKQDDIISLMNIVVCYINAGILFWNKHFVQNSLCGVLKKDEYDSNCVFLQFKLSHFTISFILIK